MVSSCDPKVFARAYGGGEGDLGDCEGDFGLFICSDDWRAEGDLELTISLPESKESDL